MNEENINEYSLDWTRLAGSLMRGTPVKEAFSIVVGACVDSELKPVWADVLHEIENGSSVAAALANHADLFPEAIIAIVRTGEQGGILDVAATAIVEGLKDQTIPIPGIQPPPMAAEVRYWRLFGLVLSAGVPLVEALRLMAEVAETPLLRDATHTLCEAVAAGRRLSSEMAAFPHIFPTQIRAAVIRGEEKGEIDKQVLLIAEAIKTRDMLQLVEGLDSVEDSDNPASKWASDLLGDAVERGASDIHIEPTDDGQGRIRFRVDGVLHDVEPPPYGLFTPLLSHIKSISGMDTVEHRIPQDGRAMLRLGPNVYDFRTGALPSVRGERIVIRILNQIAANLTLSQVMNGEILERVRALCRLPHGVIICTGPVGSGKTTLMYSMLVEIDRDKESVMSIEDPVEVLLNGVTQLQIRPDIGLTFAAAARAVMRQDPDVVMIGELRDLETTEMAMKIAINGHLVLTQTHATSAAVAVKRLIDMGIKPFMITSVLAAVTSQRLVRCLCKECRKPSEPRLELMAPDIAEKIRRLPDKNFHVPQGCEACHGTGFKHRVAVYELLEMNDRVANAITANADAATIHNAAIAAGMKTMLDHGLELASQGVTSLEEVLRVL